MIEHFVLGIIQGVAEWLPISSEAMIILVKTNFFASPATLAENIQFALFLHLGTFLAALIYFRAEIKKLIIALFQYKKADAEIKLTFKFLIISTIISGLLGFLLLKTLTVLEEQVHFTGRIITAVIGILLIATGFLQHRADKKGQRDYADITPRDSLLLGIAQGLAVLPGFSRSGFTVASLLLLKFKDTTALKLSFLMSLPIVLAGNIVLNYEAVSAIKLESLVGLGSSFVFGWLTIALLLHIAEKINFGTFVIAFGTITIVAAYY